jgi:division protein 1
MLLRSHAPKEYVSGLCVCMLEGHSKAVTVLYFENNTLIIHFSFFSIQSIILKWMRKPLAHQVSGASNKTLHQWDLVTGQCVMTMDILWAILHLPMTIPTEHMARFPMAGMFTVLTPLYVDGIWELYQDFIGAMQSSEYTLMSRSGDSAVRMWDIVTILPPFFHFFHFSHSCDFTCP